MGAPPGRASWIAAIFHSAGAPKPLGAGLVIDQHRVLTNAHVVPAGGREGGSLWVEFPHAENPVTPGRAVTAVRVSGFPRADLAILELEQAVPEGVEPARLRRPTSEVLVSKAWWAFGFPLGDPFGNDADGLVGATLGYGWVRLDTSSRYLVEQGFSGGGLWCADYDAVVAVVGQANERGDGRAVTLDAAAAYLPAEGIGRLTEWTLATVNPDDAAAWGWSLETDAEAHRHWRPRARGVTVESESGHRFRGRRAALTRINAWLDATPVERKVLVVSGSPGVGKSAVLGRVVTTADPGIAAALPLEDTAIRASLGSIACAVHAKGKTALEVAREIAAAASAALPDQLDDLLPALATVLQERGWAFNVVIDAIDEAASPREARALIVKVAVPIAETLTPHGARVVVGTRRVDDAGDLLQAFGTAAELVDLDTPEYFAVEDLQAYTQATLQLLGDERAGNPYTAPDIAAPVAHRIAALADGNFLIAGLEARARGLHDTVAAVPEEITFTADVGRALRDYLDRVPGIGDLSAWDLLTPLAFAESPGWTVAMWSAICGALLGTAPQPAELAAFVRGAAAAFLVQTTPDDEPTVRLFHQALSDALREVRASTAPPEVDERAITRALLALGGASGWDHPPYLGRSLAGHAARGRAMDELLSYDAFLLHADLRRLIPLADQATTATGRARARLLRLTPEAISASPLTRAAMFSVTQTLEHLDSGFRALPGAPYEAVWASSSPERALAVLTGHTNWVNGVCAVPVGERTLLASASDDATVRLWDPTTGDLVRTLSGHTGPVNGVCAVQAGQRTLLVTASDDATVRLWDPTTGAPVRTLTGHTGPVNGVCAAPAGERTLLATASADATVRLWDPTTGASVRTLTGHTGRVRGVCAVPAGERALLASASDDATVRLWDPRTGEHVRTLSGHAGGVRGLCAVPASERTLLATASDDATVRLWDPTTGAPVRTLTGHTDWVRGVCAVQAGQRTLLVTASDDATVRLWDPRTGEHVRTLSGHAGGVRGLCAVPAGERALLATASDDATLRLWDPTTGETVRTLSGHTGWVSGVCTIPAGERTLLATASADATVRLWDPTTGALVRTLEGHTGWVSGVCAVPAGERTLLATASADATVRLWDPTTGAPAHTLTGHTGPVRGVCAVPAGERTLLATASADATVRLWDPTTGAPVRTLTGHTDWVRGVCAVQAGQRTLLVTAGDDATVRLWDPTTGAPVRTLTGHTGPVRGVCAVPVGERTLLASASEDRTVRLWNPTTAAVLGSLPVHHRAQAITPLTTSLLAVGLENGALVLHVSAP